MIGMVLDVINRKLQENQPCFINKAVKKKRCIFNACEERMIAEAEIC